MRLRERNYQSRLGQRRVSGSSERERFKITPDRPPRKEINIASVLVRWGPVVLVAAIGWYLLETYVF